MPLPSSGPLSFSAIRAEVVPGGTNNNVSLRTLSSTAGFSTPDAVSEFYGYGNITYSYYGTWVAGNPCSYDYWNVYLGSNGVYYRQTSVGGVDFYTELDDYTNTWFEPLYYDPNFMSNVYRIWYVNSTSTVLTNGGNFFSEC